jgi:hypothetical protein
MAHKSLPRDSCGGSKSCGGNLLAVGSTEQPESFVRRNLRAMTDLVSAFKISRDLAKKDS